MIVEQVADFADAVDEVAGNKDFGGTWFKDILSSHNIAYHIMSVHTRELIEPEASVMAITNGWDQNRMLVLWRASHDSVGRVKYLCVILPNTNREELIKLIVKTMSLKAFL